MNHHLKIMFVAKYFLLEIRHVQVPHLNMHPRCSGTQAILVILIYFYTTCSTVFQTAILLVEFWATIDNSPLKVFQLEL